MGRGRKKNDYGGFFVIQIPVPEKRKISTCQSFSSTSASASRGSWLRRSLLDSSTLALRNARKTLGKERDCSQSTYYVIEVVMLIVAAGYL